MNRFVSLALVLFACVAVVKCHGHGVAPGSYGCHAAPSAYGGGGSSAYGAGGSYTQAKYIVAASAPSAGYVSSSHSAVPVVSGYGAAPAGYGAAPAGYGALPAGYGAVPAGYGAAPASYAAAPAGYAAAPSAGYGGAPAPGGYGQHGYAAPKYSVLPAYITEINRGKHNYKTYQTPIKYTKVSLPIIPSDPIAKLFVPDHAGGYGGNHAVYGGGAAY